MTDLPPEGGAPNAAQDQAPQLRVLAQYVKDASFENPGAPQSLQTGQPQPQVQLSIDLGVRKMDEQTQEVTLGIQASAKRGEDTVFIAELVYGGLFAFLNIPENERQPVALIECPRILFPFARQIIADMTQHGGLPPVMLEPVDFAALYRQRLAQQQQAEQGEQNGGNGGNGPAGGAPGGSGPAAA